MSAEAGDASSTNLWGGRFAESPDEFLVRFSRSIHVDARLLQYDLAASRAWADELRHCGVLEAGEHEHVDRGLRRLGELHSPADAAAADVEDIHTWIELNLVELIGDPARRLHTGRSRNDQVMTAMRMWMREACDQLTAYVGDVARTLIGLAQRSEGCVVPAYTHMQRAQPMLLGHWCMSWVDGFERDVERLAQARQRIDVLPLGSGACVGTSIPVDRERLATALGFGAVSTNSIDAVSDRDSCIDLATACAQMMARLSRLAEDLLLYTGPEYGFLSVADGVTTGSSLLPHKRNLDSMELVRGKAGRVFGSLQSLLVMSKGVSTAYARDLQEDKPALFDAVDTTGDCLTMTALVVAGAQPCAERMRFATEHGFLEAMELADHLVASGVPFRDAHQQAGRLVRAAETAGTELRDLSLDSIREHAPKARDDIHDDLTIEASLARRDIIGGTAPGRVKRAIERASVQWSEPRAADDASQSRQVAGRKPPSVTTPTKFGSVRVSEL